LSETLVIEGGKRLKGEVEVSGSKNAALPILFASLLADGKTVLRRVPELRDVASTRHILRKLGCECERRKDGGMEIEVTDSRRHTAPYELVSKMRASTWVMGPLLARRKKARVSKPGGCVIGARPIDLHLRGLAALGAKIEETHGYIELSAERLRGAEIYLGGPFGSSVGATANTLMAAALAEGTTVIDHAACEPEIADLAGFLVAMGAKIKGIGTPRVVIEGVERLNGTDYTVIPDRIEAGTYLIAGAMASDGITIRNCAPEHMRAVIAIMQQTGAKITEQGNGILRVAPPEGLPRAVDVATLPYPGFPTDMQAQFMAYMATAGGISIITEKIYPDRFMHIMELNRLGAKIRKEGNSAIIEGRAKYSGAEVMASDLRASAALILSGITGEGRTLVHRIYHLERGYERLEEKLNALGADVSRG
jgi:UDP-N-acetylglucosamine 1-carboxyvinyltransferase